MSRSFIGATAAAGNASDAVVFTMPANYEGFISNILAYNSTGGSLDLTITLTRAGLDNVILAADAVASGSTSQYGAHPSKPICPLVMQTGDILKAKGSSTGLTVTISGISFSI